MNKRMNVFVGWKKLTKTISAMVLKSRYHPVPSNTIAVSTESTKNPMEKYTFLETYTYLFIFHPNGTNFKGFV